MSNFKKIIAMIFVLIYGFISCFSVIGSLTGKYTTSYNGFAVDKEENVYIGYPEGKIKVYKDNEYVKTIFSGTNRGFDFTIVDGDKIYVYIAPQGYFLDLNGKRIEYQGGEFDSFYTYRPRKSEIVFDDGVIYKQKFNMGRTKIVKISDDITETVYQMPLDDYIVKMIVFSDYLFLVVAAFYLLYMKFVKRKP